MPVSSGLRRLLHLRKTEEQNKQVLFALLVAELRQLQADFDFAQSQEESGRALVRNSALSGELQDRYIGLVETICSSKMSMFMNIRIERTSAEVAAMQAELVGKHREEKQIEILIRTELERDTTDSQRRLQVELDEWARSRGTEHRPNSLESSGPVGPHLPAEPITTTDRDVGIHDSAVAF